MLSRRLCPHTGIVNFFALAEPLLPVGSVIRAAEPAGYHWRYYLGQEAAVGIAPDMRTAENFLISSHHKYLQTPDCVVEVAAAEGRNERRVGNA